MSTFDDLPEPERELARSLRTTLRAGDHLESVTASRLRAARARALAAPRPATRGWLYASGGLAAAAIVAAVIVLRMPSVTLPNVVEAGTTAQAEAIEILTDDVDADFYEDLELYRWLDRNRDGAA
jgi:hypothetical protein